MVLVIVTNQSIISFLRISHTCSTYADLWLLANNTATERAIISRNPTKFRVGGPLCCGGRPIESLTPCFPPREM